MTASTTKEYRVRMRVTNPSKLQIRSIHMWAPLEKLEPVASLVEPTVQLRHQYLLVFRHPMNRARSVLLKPYYGSGATGDAVAMSATGMEAGALVGGCRKAGTAGWVVQWAVMLYSATCADLADSAGAVEDRIRILFDVARFPPQQDLRVE